MSAEVSYGDDAPNTVNLIIEIQKGGRNKYELDKATGKITLDRVNGTYFGYPTDYGYVPDTLCDDGAPLDGLLIIDESVPAGIVVPVRAIGVLFFEDDGENDHKGAFFAGHVVDVWHDCRHTELHAAGARRGTNRPGECPQRCLLAGSHFVRTTQRPSSVPRIGRI